MTELSGSRMPLVVHGPRWNGWRCVRCHLVVVTDPIERWPVACECGAGRAAWEFQDGPAIVDLNTLELFNPRARHMAVTP